MGSKNLVAGALSGPRMDDSAVRFAFLTSEGGRRGWTADAPTRGAGRWSQAPEARRYRPASLRRPEKDRREEGNDIGARVRDLPADRAVGGVLRPVKRSGGRDRRTGRQRRTGRNGRQPVPMDVRLRDEALPQDAQQREHDPGRPTMATARAADAQ